MGQCYSVYLKVKLADEKGAINALNNFVDTYEHANFYAEEFENEGIDRNTIEGLFRAIFGGWNFNHPKYSVDKGTISYECNFDASYGWEYVMTDGFAVLAPYASGTYKCYPDSGCTKGTIKNGVVEWK